MRSYADYSYYVAQYGGRKLTAEEFIGYAPKASALIDDMTCGRAARYEGDEVGYACCAVCEQMQINDKRAGIASETVGKVSRTYITDKQRQLCLDAARVYLGITGLLGTGVHYGGVV